MTRSRRTTPTPGPTKPTTNPFAWSPGDGSPAAEPSVTGPAVYPLPSHDHALRRCSCCYSLMPRSLFKPVCIGCYAETERDQADRRKRRIDRHRID
jgi:hypothetical protein